MDMLRFRRRVKLGALLTVLFGSLALACTLIGSITTRKVLGRDSPLLAFDATPGSNGKIYLVNSGGLLYTSIRATHQTDDDCCPVWSPDGTRLAYISFPYGNSQADIFLLELNGSTLLRQPPVGDRRRT